MTYELIAEIAWKSVITSGLALLLLRLVKDRSAAERSWVAHAGLIATLLLPLAVIAMPAWQVEAPAPITQVFAEAEPAVATALVAASTVAAAQPVAEPAFTIDGEA